MTAGECPHVSAHASSTLTDLAIEFIQLVRGTDKERFIKNAQKLGVPDRLRYRLRSASPRLRLEAAEALAEFGDPRSIQGLQAALDDSNADVRLAAALSLAAAGAAPPARELVTKLQLGTHEKSKLIVSLFRVLAKSRPEEIKELIVGGGYPPAVKAAAVEALATSGDYSLVPTISHLVLLASPKHEALPHYLRALGVLGHPAAAEALKHGLDSPEWKVRAAAAEAAGHICLLECSERLTELLGDTNWWVRFRAAQSLTRMGAEGRKLLTNVATAGEGLAREAARLTLAERKLL